MSGSIKEPFSDALTAHRHNAILEACVDVLKRALVDEGLQRGQRRLLAQLVEGVLEGAGDVETYFRELQPHKLASDLAMAHQSVKNALSMLRARGYILSEAMAGTTVYTVQPHTDPDFLRNQLRDYCARIRENDNDDRTHRRVPQRTNGRVPYPPAGIAPCEDRTRPQVLYPPASTPRADTVPAGRYAPKNEIEENQTLSSEGVLADKYGTCGRVLHYNNSSSKNETLEKLTTVSPVTTVVGHADLFEGGPCPGVELPSVVQWAISAHTAPTASRNFIDAVKSAQRRKVEAFKIEMACRKAVAAACSDAGDREPSPSAILQKAARFVERSDAEAIAVPLAPRSTGAPRARNMSRDFDVPPPDPTLSIYGGPWED